MSDNGKNSFADLIRLGRGPSERSWWWRYGLAVGCVVLGWLGKEALSPMVGRTASPFIFFFPAVAGVALYGGFGPAVTAALLATATAKWFFIEPIRTFSIRDWDDAVVIPAFLTGCLFIAGAIQAMHHARRRMLDEIAGRERMTRELAQARDSLATTLASIGDGVIVADANGQVTFLNGEAERLTEWKNREAAGQPLSTVFHIINEYSRESVENPAEKVFRTGRVVGLANHTILVGKDGTETPIDDSAAPVRQGDGPLSGLVLVFRDVTEQHKAEAVRTRLAAIVEFSGDAIFTKTLDGTIETWNAGAERFFGYRASEIVGQSIRLLVPPEYLGEEHQILDRLHAGLPSQRIETVRVAKDGRRLAVSVNVSPLRDREGRVVGASTTMHDISQRKEAETALKATKERLVAELQGMQRLHELGTLLLREADLPSLLRQVLAASVELLGADKGTVQLYAPDEKTLKIVAQIGHNQDFLRHFSAISATDHLSSGIALAKKQRVIIEDIFSDPAFPQLRPIAQQHGFAAVQCTPLFGSDGEVFGILATHFRAPHRPSESELQLLDLYAQLAERLIERNRAMEAVREAQEQLARVNAELEKTVQVRTAALQEMVTELQHVSYAITHDMRAPLRAMSTFAQLLLNDTTAQHLSPVAQDYCRRIVTGASRLDTLIRDALNYTRAVLQSLPMQPVDLDPLVRGLLDTYPNLHPEMADIEIDGRLPVVQGNESLLTQCFSNLLGNAVKFVAPGRKAKVRVWADVASPVAQISVRDEGIGIPRHAQPRLFGMFQKLDNQYEGTGIGLAIVRKVAERMEGKVGVESEPDEGSRFWVELPLAEPERTL
jgi:PAS domain S-box-containing protein